MEPASEIRGRFLVRIRDKHGRLKKELVAYNGITNVGKDEILAVMFNAKGTIGSRFIGMIDSASFSALADGDTMSSHAGWIENQDYDEASRPNWVEDAPSGQQITNSSAAVFTYNASKTIKGFFLVDSATKGGTTGILWCTALFAEGDQVVVATDTIEVTYTLTAAGD